MMYDGRLEMGGVMTHDNDNQTNQASAVLAAAAAAAARSEELEPSFENEERPKSLLKREALSSRRDGTLSSAKLRSLYLNPGDTRKNARRLRSIMKASTKKKMFSLP